MSQSINIDGFHKDEDVGFTLLAKARDGSVIANPATQDVIFNIGSTPEGAADLTFSKNSGDATLTDVDTALYTFAISAADLTSLDENRTYYYTLWTKSATNDKILQNKGVFRLLNSIKIPD